MAGKMDFSWAKESSWGGWTTPTVSMPVRTATITPTQPLMASEETAFGRGARPGNIGEVGVTAAVTSELHPVILPNFIQAIMGTRARVDVGTAISNASVANPTVITTAAPHGLTSGDSVTIVGATTTPTINGTRVVTVTDSTHFTVPINVTVGGAQTGTYVNTVAATKSKLLPNDDVDFDSFSFQNRYSNALALSARGLRLNQLTISAAARQYALAAMDFVGKDVAVSGGVWADGSGAPAVAATAYPAIIPDAFKFYQGVMRLGGTVALTSGELVVSGGTARNDFDSLEIAIAENLSTDAYGVNLGDRTLQSLNPGTRDITCRFQPNFDIVGAEFLLAWQSGAQAIAELYFRGGLIGKDPSTKYELKITIPYLQYTSGALPEVSRNYGLRRVSVEGMAKVDPATGYDIGITITSNEDFTD
jgi:hypothetical protein